MERFEREGEEGGDLVTQSADVVTQSADVVLF